MKTLPEILESACTEGREWADDKTLPEIWQECQRGDWMIWLLRNSGAEVSHVQWVRVAIACAEQVAHLNPDPRVQAAIDAAKAWCDAPTDENKKAAADAAADAAWAAEAADSALAALAAWAADAAARAAWAAAKAADAAAYAAANAAANAVITSRRHQADLIRQIIPNPFTQE